MRKLLSWAITVFALLASAATLYFLMLRPYLLGPDIAAIWAFCGVILVRRIWCHKDYVKKHGANATARDYIFEGAFFLASLILGCVALDWSFTAPYQRIALSILVLWALVRLHFASATPEKEL